MCRACAWQGCYPCPVELAQHAAHAGFYHGYCISQLQARTHQHVAIDVGSLGETWVHAQRALVHRHQAA